MDVQHIAAPVAGKDYPRNWSEFLDWFASEEACLGYLEKLRWPGGFVCPACGVAEDPYRSSRSRLMCRNCSHQGSVTAGTIFDKTRTPLRVWLAAAWYVTNQKLGVSALGLKRVLGLGSYETAWTMLHRFRRAMVRPERELLKGEVEVDETYLAISDRDKPLSSEGRKSKTNKIRRGHRRGNPPAQGLRSDPLAPHRQRLRCLRGAVREGEHRARRAGANRRIGGLPLIEQDRLRAQPPSHARRRVTGPCHDARRAPGGIPGQALDPGHASWLGPGHLDAYLDEFVSASTGAPPPRAACCSTG